jgi:hypothetical protein
LAEKANPFFHGSMRDLESLAQRFVCMRLDNPASNLPEQLFNACVGEFAGGIQEAARKRQFIAKLAILTKHQV